MNILVTGGTGFLGQHLVTKLLASGQHVSIAGRDFQQAPHLLAAGATPILADLRDEKATKQAYQQQEIVYHVGALSAAWGEKADFECINVAGTQAVVRGCLEYGVKRLIYVSSPSVVFTARDIINATEAIPYPRRFTSIYAQTKKLGEDIVNAAADKMEIVIIRPKAIFGPGDRTLLPQLLRAAQLKRLPQIGDGHNLVDLTYVENVVQALLLASQSPQASGKTYTITNDEHVELWSVIKKLLQEVGLPFQLRSIPLSVALAAATVMEANAKLTGQEPLLTRYSAAILGYTQTYDISAARKDLGYTPHLSIAEGIQRTLERLHM